MSSGHGSAQERRAGAGIKGRRPRRSVLAAPGNQSRRRRADSCDGTGAVMLHLRGCYVSKAAIFQAGL